MLPDRRHDRLFYLTRQIKDTHEEGGWGLSRRRNRTYSGWHVGSICRWLSLELMYITGTACLPACMTPCTLHNTLIRYLFLHSCVVLESTDRKTQHHPSTKYSMFAKQVGLPALPKCDGTTRTVNVSASQGLSSSSSPVVLMDLGNQAGGLGPSRVPGFRHPRREIAIAGSAQVPCAYGVRSDLGRYASRRSPASKILDPCEPTLRSAHPSPLSSSTSQTSITRFPNRKSKHVSDLSD